LKLLTEIKYRDNNRTTTLELRRLQTLPKLLNVTLFLWIILVVF